MSQVQVNTQVVACEYDFANDGSAGAVGTILTGVWVPPYAILNASSYRVITTFTSGGAATLSWVLKNAAGTTIVTLAAAGAIAGYPTANRSTNGSSINDVPTYSDNLQIAMVIGTAALTAGRIIYALRYQVTAPMA